MEAAEAAALLGLGGGGAGPYSPAQLRKAFLRAALRAHPDKNRDDLLAATRFQRLAAAYDQLLRAGHDAAAAQQSADHHGALVELLRQALQGQDVEAALQRLGAFRPPPEFGVDLNITFDSRLPAGRDSCGGAAPAAEEGSSSSSSGEPLDLQHVFADVFRAEGMTPEGDPLEGWGPPPED